MRSCGIRLGLSTCGKLMWKTATPVDNYKTSRADCTRPANKKDTLGECPGGYAPVETGVRADAGDFALDTVLTGADAEIKAVSLYSDGEKS